MEELKKVLILGGTSYLGQALVHALAAKGFQVNVLSRHPERARGLKVSGNTYVQHCDIQKQPEKLESSIIGMDVVINLIDHHSGHYEEINRNIASKVGKLCEKNKIARLIHLSAVGAMSSLFHNQYLHAHAMAEKSLMALFYTKVTILRPSWIIGRSSFGAPAGQFEKLLMGMRKHKNIRVFGANTMIAPVHIQDVVNCVLSDLECMDNNKRLILTGPEVMSIMQYIRRIKSEAFLGISIHKVHNFWGSTFVPFSYSNHFLFPEKITDFSTPLDGSEKIVGQRVQGKRHLSKALQELLQESESEHYCRLRK